MPFRWMNDNAYVLKMEAFSSVSPLRFKLPLTLTPEPELVSWIADQEDVVVLGGVGDIWQAELRGAWLH